MKTLNGTAYFREDLSEAYKDQPIQDIKWHMLSIASTGVLLKDDIVIFCDHDLQTKVIKNRFGYEGLVVKTP